MPAARFAFLDHPGPIPFAHRGGAAGGLENSLLAFQRAVDLGYRYLETDVHATADGVLLAFHDRTLDRVTDRRGRVAQLPYREVSRARIGGSEPIPLLEELVGAWPEVRINIDVKDVPAIEPLAQLIERTGSVERVCVASFSPRRLAAVRRRLGPRLCTSLDPRGVARLLAGSYGRPLRLLLPRHVPAAQVPATAGRLPLVTRRFLDTAHRVGMQVHVWTVDEAAQIEHLLDLGVDGVMTDRIETLRAVLMRRGQWVTP